MKTTSPFRSTAPNVDLEARFTAQRETVNKYIDDKLSIMSSALMSQFSSMLDQFKIGFNNSFLSGNLGVPGYSVSQTEPPSLQCPVSTESESLRFQDGGEDPVPHGLGLAQGGDSSLARPQLGADAAPSRDPPAKVSGKAQRPADHSGPRVCFAQPIDFCAVAPKAAHAARLHDLRRLLNGADQYLVRVQSSSAFGFLPT